MGSAARGPLQLILQDVYMDPGTVAQRFWETR